MSEGRQELDNYRVRAGAFIDRSIDDGLACGEFGSIMPPALFEKAAAWQRHMYSSGFAGIDWPADFGGGGLTSAHQAIWLEECARRSIAPYMNFQGFVLAGGAIRTFGTSEQKAQYLDTTLSADIVWCQLFSEPGSGSDLGSLRTMATRTHDGWTVTGQKVWTSTAQLAQHGILLARTDPQTAGSRGLSFFLLDMAAPGIEVRPIKQMTGDHEFCEVFLADVPVASCDLLGPEHGGWSVALSVLGDERSAVGSARLAQDRQLERVGETVNLTDASIRDRLLVHTVDANALGHLLGRSAGDALLGPLTKLGRTEMQGALTRLALDGQGAAGMVVGTQTEPFLYAPGMRVAGGTSEIQRNLIGEQLLGLPREPKAT